MKGPSRPNSYRELVQKTWVPTGRKTRSPEQELDSLLSVIKDRQEQNPDGSACGMPDPTQRLRELMVKDLIPVFVELVEKYSKSGISMQMDASNFLEGGREIKLEFGIGDFRTQMHGTVTTEAVAFHETRHTPDIHGELVSGPMLRMRGLNADVFRNFICERLTILLRSAMRRR